MKHVIKVTLLLSILTMISCGDLFEDIAEDQAIEKCERIVEAERWKSTDSFYDYHVTCDLVIDSDVTIDPDTRILMADGASITITENGSLLADGNADELIEFVSNSGEGSRWNGIFFKSTSTRNELEHVVIEQAGSARIENTQETNAAVIISGRVKLNNTMIDQSGGSGILLPYSSTNDFRLGRFSNIEIKNCEEYPLFLDLRTVPEIQNGNGNTYINNGINMIRVIAESSVLDISQSWNDRGIPYSIKDMIEVETAFIINKGVEMVFEEEAGITMFDFFDDQNYLKVDGGFSSTEGVKMSAAQGSWRGITISSNNSNNIFQGLRMDNAGVPQGSGPRPAVHVKSESNSNFSSLSLNGLTISVAECILKIDDNSNVAGLSTISSQGVSQEICN